VDCLVEVQGKVQVVPILNSSPGAIWVQFHACLTMALDIGNGQFLVPVAHPRYPKNRRLGAPRRQSRPFTCWMSCIPQCSCYTDSSILALQVEEHMREPTFLSFIFHPIHIMHNLWNPTKNFDKASNSEAEFKTSEPF
jgi:hypothetical protein